MSPCDVLFYLKLVMASATASLRRKRKSLSLREKVEIIHRIQKGEKQVSVAEDCGIRIAKNTVSVIYADRERFLSDWEGGIDPNRKAFKQSSHSDLVKATVN